VSWLLLSTLLAAAIPASESTLQADICSLLSGLSSVDRAGVGTVEERPRIELEPEQGGGVRRGWAIATVAAPAALVYEVVTDHGAFATFLPYVRDSEVVENETGAVIVFQRVDLPFPIQDRTYSIEVQEHQTEIGGVPCRESAWSYIEGSGNVDANEGRWEVLALGPTATLVAYTALIDPGGHIATWINNWATRQAIPRVIDAVRSEAQRRLRNRDSGSAP
jgi:ribosome-associated toxin RatA of RatAB toxin-antitoxin module